MSFPDLRFIPRDRRELQRRFQAGLSRSLLEGERTRKLAFHFRRKKTEQQRVLPSLRENSRWEVFSPNEASSSPGGLGDKTEEVVWGFFRKRALMTKEISAEFSRFPSKFAARRAGSGAINNLMVCPPSVAREHNGVWEKPRCDPGVVKPGK